MRARRDSGERTTVDFGLQGRFTRPVLLLGTLLMVMALATGCSVVEELATSTTTPVASVDTTDTLRVETTTTASGASPVTTTTSPPQTTTTAAETTTTVAETSTTMVADTTTTVPPTTESPDGSQQAGGQSSTGTILYQIDDWSSGTAGWAAAGQWKTVGGMLVTDGTSDSFAVAPVDLTDYPDYVVEAEVQIVDPTAATDVLLVARMINGSGYYGGFDGSASRMAVGYDHTELGGADFVLDGQWHTLRLEVRGNSIKLFLGQAEVARATDNRALDPGTVGLYCAGGQINVRSFTVSAL
jgi:hypothetical protein